MTITCITQARLTSTRLPSKILLPITDHHNAVSLLSSRVSKSSLVDEHLFAIPDTNENEPLASYLEDNQISYITGSENDLVDRHLLLVRMTLVLLFVLRATAHLLTHF